MSKAEIVRLLKAVLADYLAMARDLHGLKKLKSDCSPTQMPLAIKMQSAIDSLSADLRRDLPWD